MYKLYGTSNTTTDSLVTLDIREDDVIEHVEVEVLCPGASDGSMWGAELSFSSSNGHSSNDTQQSLCGVYGCYDLTTSGAAVPRVRCCSAPMGVKVAAGERLHLHLYVSTTLTTYVRVWIHTKKGQMRNLTRSRI